MNDPISCIVSTCSVKYCCFSFVTQPSICLVVKYVNIVVFLHVNCIIFDYCLTIRHVFKLSYILIYLHSALSVTCLVQLIDSAISF